MTARELQMLFDSMKVKRDRIDAIDAAAKKGNRALTQEEQVEFDTLLREIQVLNGKVMAGQMPLTVVERKAAESLMNVMRSIAMGKAPEASGLRVDGNVIYLERDTTASSDVSAIQPDSIHELIEPLQKRLLIDKLGCRINTGIVGERKYPTVNNVEATIEGETTALTGQKINFTATTASPKRVGLSIPFSLLSLHQANIDLIGYAFRIMNMAAAQLLNKWMFATTKIVSAASNGCFVVAAADPVFTLTDEALTEADIIDLEIKVLNSNIENDGTAAYVAGVAAYGELKKMRDARSGQKIMIGDTLNGYPVLVSNHMENKNGVKGLGFGIFSQVELNQYGAHQIIVDNMSKSSSGVVDVNFNSFYDIEVVRKEAFAYGTFKTVIPPVADPGTPVG